MLLILSRVLLVLSLVSCKVCNCAFLCFSPSIINGVLEILEYIGLLPLHLFLSHLYFLVICCHAISFFFLLNFLDIILLIFPSSKIGSGHVSLPTNFVWAQPLGLEDPTPFGLISLPEISSYFFIQLQAN